MTERLAVESTFTISVKFHLKIAPMSCLTHLSQYLEKY